jgi:hypothetical protein
MRASRRGLLLMLSGVVGDFTLGSQLPPIQNPPARPRQRPPGDAPDDNSNSDPTAPHAANKAMLEQRQKDIKKEVEKLYKLASELKDEVEKTDATTTLSLPMVRKAEEIERLAKQIKENAKG